MTSFLVRFARRQASWEGDLSLEEVQQAEFKARDGNPDLRPSVYIVADTESALTQVYAEHCATPPITPERTTIGIDTTECADRILNTEGSPRFATAREAHREYEIPDLAALLAFVDRLRDRVKARRTREVTRERVVAYARERVRAADVEWIAVAQLDKDWLKALRRFIPTPDDK
jgi:hypothetical protein